MLSPVSRCFAHIVNLACQDVLSAITDMKYAEPQADVYLPASSQAPGQAVAQKRDPVAIVRSLVREVRYLFG